MRSLLRLVAALALVLVGVSCDGGDSGGTESSTTSTTAGGAATTTTTAASSTSSATTTATTVPPYGSVCAPGSHPDCIDPDGDGQHEYLKNGAQCMRELGDSGLCSDLDGDGVAGYPDSG